MRVRGPALALASAGLLAGAACGARAPTPLRAPPVAATAPVPAATPAGRVLDLGADRPEGVAVDPARGLLVVDTQARTELALTLPALAAEPPLRLPGSGRHVTVDGDLALVPSEGTGRLLVIDLASVAITAVAVGRAPHDVALLPGDRALVGDEADGTVSVVAGLADPATARTVQTLPAGLQPGGLSVDGDLACAADVRGRYLYVYDATPGRPVRPAGRVAVGNGPTHVVDLGGGYVAVADALADAIDVVRLSDPRVVGRFAVGASPEGLASDLRGHHLWVTTPGDNQLVELGVSGHTLHRLGTFPTVRQPNSVAVDERTGVVYVVGATPDGELQVLDPPA